MTYVSISMYFFNDTQKIHQVLILFTSRTLNSATSTFITMLLKQTHTNFEQEFCELFDPEMAHDAGERQLTLKQGKLSAASFSLMFRTLGAERGVCQGLNDTPNQTGLLR